MQSPCQGAEKNGSEAEIWLAERFGKVCVVSGIGKNGLEIPPKGTHERAKWRNYGVSSGGISVTIFVKSIPKWNKKKNRSNEN